MSWQSLVFPGASLIVVMIQLAGAPIGTRPALGDPLADLDLTLRSADDPDTWIKPTLRVDNAWFFGSKAWVGNDRELVGDDSSHWIRR